MSRFSETLLEHARYPRNLGPDAAANAVGFSDLSGGPPTVEWHLRIENGRILKASFVAAGCGVTIGVSSALSELLVGMNAATAAMLQPAAIEACVDGVPPDKQYCIGVALAALRMALCGDGTESQLS